MFDSNTVGENLSRAAAAIKVCFWRLFGVLWLYYLISCGVSWVFGESWALSAIVSLAVLLPLGAGICSCFLKAIRGQKIGISDVFAAFRSGSYLRVLGGMLRMVLFIAVWLLIPALLGIVYFFAALFNAAGGAILSTASLAMAAVFIYKLLQYSFAPLVLIDHPEVSAADALKVSMRYTSGLKGRLFGTALIFAAAEAAVALAAYALFANWVLSFQTGVGAIDAAVFAVIAVMGLSAVLGVFCGLTYASFYNNADAIFCPYRGTAQQVNPWDTAEYRNMHQDGENDRD